MNLYKWLWTRIGGRPWTYIMRDFAYRNPLLMWTMGLVIGVLLSHYFQWKWLLIFSLGFLAGHLFWGTKWRPGEKGR